MFLSSSHSTIFFLVPPPPTSDLTNPKPPKIMEELWKNIHLSSLPETTTMGLHHRLSTHNSQPTICQDFLGRPTDKAGPSLIRQNDHHHHNNHHDRMDGQNGILEGYRETGIDSVINSPCFMSCLNSPFEGLSGPSSSSNSPSTSFLLSKLCGRNKRRFDGDQHQNDEFRGDRRYKRMMKNRESAARSRARRQAYTNELELEVAHLTEENAKLRKEQEKLMLSAPVEAPPKKATLSRSLTAPF